MIVNTRTGQGPAPCKFPCSDEVAGVQAHASITATDETEAEVRVARQKVEAQLCYEANTGTTLDVERVVKEFNDRYANTHGNPHITVQGAAWLIGYIGSAHTHHAVGRLVDDPRDFNDIVDEYEHRVDPAQFARRPNA